MKKLLYVMLLMGVLCTMSNLAEAQVRFGAGLAYGDFPEELGITANALVDLPGPIDVQPSLIYYLIDGSRTIWELNGDLHYSFFESTANVYVIAGLNLTRQGFEGSEGVTELGLNLGIGATFLESGPISPFAELKYVVGDLDGIVLSGGVRF